MFQTPRVGLRPSAATTPQPPPTSPSKSKGSTPVGQLSAQKQQVPLVPAKKPSHQQTLSTPPILDSPVSIQGRGRRGTVAAVVLLRNSERLTIIGNCMIIASTFAYFFIFRREAVIEKFPRFVRLAVASPLAVPMAKAACAIALFNIFLVLGGAFTRFLRASFSDDTPTSAALSNVQSGRQAHRLRGLLRDGPSQLSSPGSVPGSSSRPSPLRSTALPSSSPEEQRGRLLQLQRSLSASSATMASQTPARSPFANQTVSPAILGSSPLSFSPSLAQLDSTPITPSLHHSPEASTASTIASTAPSTGRHKPIYSPSFKSINLQSPSVLMMSVSGASPQMTPRSPSSVAADAASPKPMSLASEHSAARPQERPKEEAVVKKEIARKSFVGEDALKELGISADWEERLESLREWLAVTVIRPLTNDIDRVERAFADSGMAHLGPASPASMTLFTSLAAGSSEGGQSAFYFAPPTSIAAGSRPHSLMDLATQSRSDPMVQLRMRIEKYLDVGSYSGLTRPALIQRLRGLAAGAALDQGSSSSVSDASLVMHLVCTFLDEKLPTTDPYQLQPFTSRYLIAPAALEGGRIREEPDLHGVPIVLQPVPVPGHSGLPAVYHVLTKSKRLVPLASGTRPLSAVLHSLTIFVAVIDRQYGGYLGVANLSSKAIGLLH